MEGFEIIDAKDKNKTLAVINDGKKYFMHSSYYPLKESQEWAEEFEFNNDSIILVYGIGLGYHVNFLLDRLNLDNRLILIEPSKEIFEYAINNGYYDKFKNRSNTFLLSMILKNV